MKLPPSTKPWQQWTDETNKAYHRFTLYMKMGPERTMREVGEKLGKSRGYLKQLEKWSVKFNWVERCKAYDEHLVMQAIDHHEEIIRKTKAIILNGAAESAKELIKIALSSGKQQMSLNEASHMSQKLKAIEIVLDKIGLKAPDDPVEKGDLTVNQYIQNIYKRIEDKNMLD